MSTKKRYYGITKVKQGQKLCWVSKQDKNGWSLGLAISKRTVWVTGLRFKSIDEVKRVVDSELTSTVFIHLKDSPFRNMVEC